MSATTTPRTRKAPATPKGSSKPAVSGAMPDVAKALPAVARRAEQVRVAGQIVTALDDRAGKLEAGRILHTMAAGLDFDEITAEVAKGVAHGVKAPSKSTLNNLRVAYKLALDAGFAPTVEAFSAALTALPRTTAVIRSAIVSKTLKVQGEKPRADYFTKAMVAAKKAEAPKVVTEGGKDGDGAVDTSSAPARTATVEEITATIRAWQTLTFTEADRTAIVAAMQVFAHATAPAPVAAKAPVAA